MSEGREGEEIKRLEDLHQDEENARRHNPRNVGMIADALREVGAARSGVIDEEGRILAGNATWEALGEAGIEKVRVVKASGDEWVVVQREGLTERQKRRLALFDNRSAEVATWSPEMILVHLTDDADILDGLFRADELETLMKELEDPGFAGEMPPMEDEEQSVSLRVTIPDALAESIMEYLDGLHAKGVRWIRI